MPSSASDTAGPTPCTPQQFVERLGRGINIGALASPKCGHPQAVQPGLYEWPTGLPYVLFAEMVDFIVQAGFRHVRLPVRWSNRATRDAHAIIELDFLRWIDQIIDACQAHGLMVVLDCHHYRQLEGDVMEQGEDTVPQASREILEQRLVNIWRQLARHYRTEHPVPPDTLAFEVYNEPHGVFDVDPDLWPDLFAVCHRVIGEEDPLRLVIWTVPGWSTPARLGTIAPPDQHANIIATVHPYGPWQFTHSGAWDGRFPPDASFTPSARAEVLAAAAWMAQWSRTTGIPIYAGEIGACINASHAGRVAHAAYASQALAVRGIPASYWDLGGDFGMLRSAHPDIEVDQPLVDAWLHSTVPEYDVRLPSDAQESKHTLALLVDQVVITGSIAATVSNPGLAYSSPMPIAPAGTIVLQAYATMPELGTPARLISWGQWDAAAISIGIDDNGRGYWGVSSQAGDRFTYDGGNSGTVAALPGMPVVISLFVDLDRRTLVVYCNGQRLTYALNATPGQILPGSYSWVIGAEQAAQTGNPIRMVNALPGIVSTARIAILPAGSVVDERSHARLIEQRSGRIQTLES